MAVDWRLGLVSAGQDALDYMDAFQAGRKATIEQNAIRTREAGRAKASTQLASGDIQGAQRTAINSGDFDYAKALSGYSEDQRKQFDAEAEALGSAAYGIKAYPKEQRRQAFASAARRLQGVFSPDEIRAAYNDLEAQGWSDAALDGYVSQAIGAKDALAAHTKSNEQYTLAPGSARYDANGKLINQQPFAPQLRSVGAGESLVEIQPGGGGPASGGGGGLTVEGVLPAIAAQESGGNYAARNAETGALGAYQVMPATGQALAQRLGVPWRPDLMASNSPEARAYQDQIGRAAVEEAVNASGGDPSTMASYYHGGSDRSKWGPRTQQYAQEVTARLNGGGSRVVAQGAPKQEETYSILTAQDAANLGLPPGPVYQRNNKTGETKSVTGTASAGGSGLTKQQAGLYNGKIQQLRTIEAQIGRVERAMAAVEKKGNTGAFMGYIPGRFDAESDVFDKAVAGLSPLIRQLTRVPGEGSMSDYESRLSEATLPSRTDTPAGRREAIATMKDLIKNSREGYQELLSAGGPAATANPPSSARKPSVSNW